MIENPNYPDPFPPGLVCIWTILPELGHTVNLTFTQFSYPNSDCNTTYVEVKEGERDRAPTNLLGKYCASNNTVPAAVIASSLESVTVSLISNRELKGAFRIEWVSVGKSLSFPQKQRMMFFF